MNRGTGASKDRTVNNMLVTFIKFYLLLYNGLVKPLDTNYLVMASLTMLHIPVCCRVWAYLDQLDHNHLNTLHVSVCVSLSSQVSTPIYLPH